MGDAPHGPLVFGVPDESGGGIAGGVAYANLLGGSPGVLTGAGVWGQVVGWGAGVANGLTQTAADVTIPAAQEGDYEVQFNVALEGGTATGLVTDIRAVVQVNGVVVSALETLSLHTVVGIADSFTLFGQTILALAPGDTVEVWMTYVGAAATVTPSVRASSLSVMKVGP